MNKRILIIDDDEGVRGAYELALEDIDAALQLAESGPEAIILAARQRPDLVFLDLRMPEMDGVEVLRELTTLYPDLLVYIVTAFANEYMLQLKAARADGLNFEVAAKPLNGEQIRTVARVSLSH